MTKRIKLADHDSERVKSNQNHNVIEDDFCQDVSENADNGDDRSIPNIINEQSSNTESSDDIIRSEAVQDELNATYGELQALLAQIGNGLPNNIPQEESEAQSDTSYSSAFGIPAEQEILIIRLAIATIRQTLREIEEYKTVVLSRNH